MHELSDKELVERLRRGDLPAFDILYQKYSGPLMSFLFRMIRDETVVEDLFHETFIRILENADRYNPRFSFSTWVYKIASNLCINEIHKRKRECFLDSKSGSASGNGERGDFSACAVSGDADPLAALESDDEIKQVQELLEALPEKHRLTFLLKFYYDMTYREIAFIEECSEGTIKSRIHYGLETLRQKMQEEQKCTRRTK